MFTEKFDLQVDHTVHITINDETNLDLIVDIEQDWDEFFVTIKRRGDNFK